MSCTEDAPRPYAIFTLPRFAARWSAIALLASALCMPGAAFAQCLVDPPGTDPATPGDIVTCASNWTSYAVDPGVDDVTVNVLSGVTMSTLLGGDVIRVNDDSNVTNNGTLRVSDVLGGAAAIRAGRGIGAADVASITNDVDGAIIVSNDGNVAIDAGSFSNVRNEGTIDVSGTGSDAIRLGTPLSGSTTAATIGYNSGTITLAGDAARGMVSTQTATLLNDVDGVIQIDTAAIKGIALGFGAGAADSVASNLGTINAVADEATAMNSSIPGTTGITMSNGGTITMAGVDSWGMYALDDAVLENSATGVMSMQGDRATAMEMGVSGRAANYGTITLDGADSVAITAAGGTGASDLGRLQNGVPSLPDALIQVNGRDSVGMRAGDWARIENFSQIAVVGLASSGIEAGANATINQHDAGTLLVQGGYNRAIKAGTGAVIDNDGLIELESGFGIAVETGTNANVTNNGRVTVRGTDAVAFAIGGQTSATPPPIANLVNEYVAATTTTPELPGEIFSYDPDAGPLVRFGMSTSGENRLANLPGASITANVDNAATPGRGIAILGSAGRDSILNYGFITGKIDLAAGSDTYIQGTSGGISVPAAGGLTGGSGNDTLLLREVSGFPFASMDLSILDSFERLQVASGLWYVGESPTGAMDIQVDKGATLSLVAPVSVTGAYDHEGPLAPMETGATLQVYLNADTLANPALHVTDTASLDDGVLDLKVGGGVTGDATFTIVLADSLITEEFDSIQLNQAGITFDDPGAYLNTNELTITVHIPGYEGNEPAVNRYLTRVDATVPNASLQTVLDSLNGLALADYKAAIAQLQPEAYDAQAATLLSLANRFNQTLLERPRYCVAKRDASAVDPKTGLPCHPRRWEPWVTVYGQTGKRDGAAGHTSWEDSGGGLIGGLDFRLNPDVMLGGSIGTAYDSLRVDDVGKARLTTIDLGLYGGYTRGPLQLEGLLSYGRGIHTGYRNITEIPGFGATAKGEFNSTRISTRAHAEYTFEVSRIELSPLASLDYTYLGQDAFDEEGASPVNLHVDTRADNIVTIRIGGEMGLAYHKKDYWTDWFEFADGVWRPHLGVRWRQVVAGAEREISSHIIGTDPSATGNLDVEGDDANMGFELSAGIEFSPKSANRLSFGLRYDGFLWENVQTHDLSGQVRFSF